jgi:lysophospholipase L1-like esterase
MEIRLAAIGADKVNQPSYYRIWIDDELLEIGPRELMSTTGELYRQRLVFPTGGANMKHRRVRVEGQQVAFAGVRIGTSYSIWKSNKTLGPKAVWVTDSFGARVNFADGWATINDKPWIWDGFIQVASRYLGWNSYSHSVGSQGWGGTINDVPQLGDSYVNDVIGRNPEIVVIALGYNDYAQGTTTYDAQINSTFAASAAQLPNARHFVFGPWTPKNPGTGAAQYSGVKTSLQTRAAQYGFSFVDIESWMVGTGKVTAPGTDGNNSIYTSDDGVHPTITGQIYLGERFAAALGANVARRSSGSGAGPTGPTGPVGATGPVGVTGATGPSGAGGAGVAGETVIASWNITGNAASSTPSTMGQMTMDSTAYASIRNIYLNYQDAAGVVRHFHFTENVKIGDTIVARYNADPRYSIRFKVTSAPVFDGSYRVAIGVIPVGINNKLGGSADSASIAFVRQPRLEPILLGIEGTLVASSGHKFKIYNDSGEPRYILSVRASVNVAPQGAAIVCDVKKDGTSIFGIKPTIAISGTTNQTTTFTNEPARVWAAGSYITAGIDSVGTSGGTDITFQIECI